MLPRSKLDPHNLQILRNKNRISAKAYYRRKKAKAAAKCINPSNDNVLLAPQNLIERENSDNGETQQLRGETRHFNREVDQQALSGSQPDLQINTSMSSDRVLRSMRFFLRSSSLQHSAPRSPCGTPSISSIHSVEISSCPSSPASTASSELKRDFQAKLRKYQRLKSKELCIFAKVFEKIVTNEMTAVVSRHISVHQYGFFKGRSVDTNLVTYTDHIINAGYQVDAVYTDFSKCFDKIDHSILLQKLFRIGIHGHRSLGG